MFQDNPLVHQLVNKQNFDNIKMHGTNVNKKTVSTISTENSEHPYTSPVKPSGSINVVKPAKYNSHKYTHTFYELQHFSQLKVRGPNYRICDSCLWKTRYQPTKLQSGKSQACKL